MAEEEQPWEDDIDELDENLSKLSMEMRGAHWPAFAIAIALIDAGLIERSRLLSIIDDVHDLAEACAIDGEEQNEARAIGALRGSLEHSSAKPDVGGAHEWMKLLLTLRVQRKAERRQRRSPPETDSP